MSAMDRIDNGRKGSRSLAELAGRADALGGWARRRQSEAGVPDGTPRRRLVHRKESQGE